MSLEWEQVVVDSRDPVSLGRWQADALGGVVLNDSAEEFEIRSSPHRLPGLIFVQVPEAKESKNRLHLDFRPDDQQAEVDRFLRGGARRVDIGQGSVPLGGACGSGGQRVLRAAGAENLDPRLPCPDGATATQHRPVPATLPVSNTCSNASRGTPAKPGLVQGAFSCHWAHWTYRRLAASVRVQR